MPDLLESGEAPAALAETDRQHRSRALDALLPALAEAIHSLDPAALERLADALDPRLQKASLQDEAPVSPRRSRS